MPHGLHGQLARALGWTTTDVHIITPAGRRRLRRQGRRAPEYSSVARRPASSTGRSCGSPTRTRGHAARCRTAAGQVQYAELGLPPRRHVHRAAGPARRRRRRLPGIGAFLPGGTRRMSHGTYEFPAIQFDVAVAVTNTTPMGAYRGAGRPEATALLERLVDQAAHELGIDPIELRKRNLLADDVFPFTTLTGNATTPAATRLPLRHGGRRGRLRRAARPSRRERRERGDARLLGIGVAAYVEITAGGGASEFGERRGARRRLGDRVRRHVRRTARATRRRTPCSSATRPASRSIGIRLVDGDTDRVPRGGGTGGSRSLQLGGSAVHRATEALVDKAPQLAATLLEADVGRHRRRHRAGTIGVAGVPTSASRGAELATARPSRGRRPLRGRGRVRAGGRHVPVRRPHRGRRGRHRHRPGRRCVRHVAVDDCGTVMNPLLVEGQQHGGHRAGRRPGAVRRGPVRRRRQPDHLQLRRLRHRRRPPRCRASTCAPPRRRRRSTRSAPRASARRPRSARRRRCRTR